MKIIFNWIIFISNLVGDILGNLFRFSMGCWFIFFILLFILSPFYFLYCIVSLFI